MKNIQKIRQNINYILFMMHKNHYRPMNTLKVKNNYIQTNHNYPTMDYDILHYVFYQKSSEEINTQRTNKK